MKNANATTSAIRMLGCGRAAPPAGAGSVTPESDLQPVLALDHLPVGVLLENLAGAEFVEVAALVIERLAVGARALDRPDRHRAVAHQDVFLVLPAHVGDLLEAVGQRLTNRRLAGGRAADRLRPARPVEG